MAYEHKLEDREDGLENCLTCGGAEGSMPTHCPGRRLTSYELDQIYDGQRNFLHGLWDIAVPERPSAVARDD